MSKTFTSKPAVVRNRNPNTNNRYQATGAVSKTNSNRGRGAMATGRGNFTTGAGRGSPTRHSSTENTQPQQQPLDQRMSYQGGYTVISPNEKRKQEIQKQAAKETESYQQYKEQKKVGPLSYVGTTGGGEITQQQARNKLIQENRNPNMRLREKREEYRSQQKKKEEEEINQKLSKQRELADKNKMKSQQTDAEKKNKWDEDRKRKTDEFLSRFERKPDGARSQGSSNSESRPPVSDTTLSTIRATNIPSSSNIDTQIDTSGASVFIESNRNVPNDLDTLHSMFPHCDRAVLQDILEQTHSIDDAIELLSLQS